VKLDELADALKLTRLTPSLDVGEVDVTEGYVSDLLSDVLANSQEGAVLVTVQVHMNVIAVAVHAGLAAVIFAAGRSPDKLVLDKAVEEGVSLFVSDNSAFEIAGRLYNLGIKGHA
jgi:hypothetical protein